MRRLLVPVVAGAVAILVLWSLSAGGTVAQEPTPTPPLPTWTPGPVPVKTPVSTPAPHHPGGAWIRLRVRGSGGLENLWTEVQWQDGEGEWHLVEGWQGPLEGLGDEWVREWWVSQSQFGEGPFRWAIYWGAGGDLLALSAPFTLPETEGATRWVEVSLEAAPPAPIPLLPLSGGGISWVPYLLLLVGIGAILAGIACAVGGRRGRGSLQNTAEARSRRS